MPVNLSPSPTPPARLERARWVEFLLALREIGRVGEAADVVGWRTVDTWHYRKRYAQYGAVEEFEDAMLGHADILEAECIRRAFKGVEQDVWYQGEKVGTKIVYSDQLLLAALKARHPAYADKQKIDMSSTDGSMATKPTDTIEAARRIAFALTLGARNALARRASEADDGSDLG